MQGLSWTNVAVLTAADPLRVTCRSCQNGLLAAWGREAA